MGNPSELRMTYKGIRFVVFESDEPGFYQFSFQLGDKTIQGKTRTRLAGMAAFRVRRLIARKVKESSGG